MRGLVARALAAVKYAPKAHERAQRAPSVRPRDRRPRLVAWTSIHLAERRL